MKAMLWLLSGLLWTTSLLTAQSSFYFTDQEVKPGTKRHFLIPISDGLDSTFVPVTVFHGASDGETLAITAGVHGYEYPPILAAQRLIGSIDPARMKGTVILVQVANVPSFLERSPFVNPHDGKNLNRSFPGAADGTITDRIAHFISETVIPAADYFLDMHAGDAPEDLMRYAGYYSGSGRENASTRGRAMAVAMGFDHVVVFGTDGKEYMREGAPSLYTSAEAFKYGIPAVDIESGRLGLPEQDAVEQVEEAVLNLLDHLTIQPREAAVYSESNPLIITERIYAEAGYSGIFYPAKRAGDYVTEGMKLGYITDFFGKTLETVYAQAEGLLLLIVRTPPINRGETVTVIARID